MDRGDTAFILHTSGTTTGAGKPVALSDAACNAAAVFYQMEELQLPMGHLVSAVIVDLSNAYSMIDQVHLPLAMGAKVVLSPGGILNPWFYKAVAKYEVSVLFTISAMFERREKRPEAVVGELAFLCGLIDRKEPVTPRELLPGFSWERVKRADIALPQGALPSPCAQLPGALPSP